MIVGDYQCQGVQLIWIKLVDSRPGPAVLTVSAGGVVLIFFSFTCMNYVHGQDWHIRTVKNVKIVLEGCNVQSKQHWFPLSAAELLSLLL